MPGKVIIEAAGLSDVGLKRSHNEDSFLLADLESDRPPKDTIVTQLGRPSGALLVVADGMGGAAAGEVASKMAVDVVRQTLAQGIGSARTLGDLARLLQDAARQANAEIFGRSKTDKALRGMGTTMTASLSVGELLFVSQVGDSRAYLLRKGELTQLTRDQSLVGQMIYEGKMSAEDARAKLPKNVILQAVGKKESLEPVLTVVELRADDRLVMCSDGLSNLVKDDELRELVGTVGDPNKSCQVLVDLARKRGGDDNITVVVAHCAGDALQPAIDGMIPFYEDILADRGEEAIFHNPAPEQDWGDRTIVRTPLTTAKLAPAPTPPPPEAPARFAFDVDEVLGPSGSAAPPPSAPIEAVPDEPTVRVAPRAAAALLRHPSEDTTERLDRHIEASLRTAAPPRPGSAEAARGAEPPPVPDAPETTEKYPLSSFDAAPKAAVPVPAPVLPDLDATARQEARFVAKPPAEAITEAAPAGPAHSQTAAIRRVQSSLDDSGLFKRGDTGAHVRKGGGAVAKIVIVAAGLGLAVGIGLVVMLRRGPSAGPTPETPKPTPEASPPRTTPPDTIPTTPIAGTPETPGTKAAPTPPPSTPEAVPTKATRPPATVTPEPPLATAPPVTKPPPSPKPTPTQIAKATPPATPTKPPRGKTPLATPTPPPLPKVGILTVTTTPPGAYVKINGQLKGVTPKELEVPTGEPLNLLIYKAGFEDHHEPDFVLSVSRKDLALALSPK